MFHTVRFTSAHKYTKRRMAILCFHVLKFTKYLDTLRFSNFNKIFCPKWEAINNEHPMDYPCSEPDPVEA